MQPPTGDFDAYQPLPTRVAQSSLIVLATHVFATSILQTVIMGMLEVGKRANADNLQPWIVEVVVSVTTLSLVAVGLRLWSRKLKQQALWWDDWMILFSMVRIPLPTTFNKMHGMKD